MKRDQVAYFWDRVALPSEPNGCMLWTGGLNSYGYGKLMLNKKNWMVHRLAYTWLVGVIPNGLVLDHLCRTRNCVRVDHLEPVTPAENVRRGDVENYGAQQYQRAKTHCPNKHEYTEENTYRDPSRNGARRCRSCTRDRQRARYQEQKGT